MGGAAGCSYRASFGLGRTGGAGWVEKHHQDPLLQAQLGLLQLKEGGTRPQSQRGWDRDTSGWFSVPNLLLEASWGIMPAGEPAACRGRGCRREAELQLIAPETGGDGSQGCGFALTVWERDGQSSAWPEGWREASRRDFWG